MLPRLVVVARYFSASAANVTTGLTGGAASLVGVEPGFGLALRGVPLAPTLLTVGIDRPPPGLLALAVDVGPGVLRDLASADVTPVGSAEGDLAAVIEPRIMAAALDVWGETGGIISSGDVLARATVVHALTLYSTTGERLASWTVSGAGLARTSTSLRDRADSNIEQRSLELALRDAAWSFMSSFRDVQGVRRWPDERGVR